MRHTFPTYERLKRKQDIDTLFRTGKAYSVFPLKVIYLFTPRASAHAPQRAGFTVPKKKFKRAVDRQRIKRLMREAWRLRKYHLSPQISTNTQMHLFFIFTDREMPEFAAVDAAMDRIIKHLTTVQC